MHFLSPRRAWLLVCLSPLLLVGCHHPEEPVLPRPVSHAVSFSGTHVTFSGTSPQSVADGKRFTVTVTPENGYSLASAVGGTCPAGTFAGAVYTTGAIHADCTLSFAAAQTLYTLTVASDANGSIAPTGTFTVATGASQTFTATPGASFSVATWELDGNVVQTGGTTYTLASITADHLIQVTFGATGIAPSVSTLALSVNCLPGSACTGAQGAALTGTSRQITLQNTGTLSATNLTVTATGLPPGTLISNTCAGSSLVAGASCVLTVTPGSEASSDCTVGIEPTPATLAITADGGLSSQVSVVVLGYGCHYQGGLIFALDDTTPNTGSVGGKVLAYADTAAPAIGAGSQATSLFWSSNGAGSSAVDLSRDVIPQISESSPAGDSYAQAQTAFNASYANSQSSPFPPASAFLTCDGAVDGACNTHNILALYSTYQTQYGVGGSPYSVAPGPTPFSDYAAGVCSQTIGGYSSWYLPALCELIADPNRGCAAGGQSISANLAFLLGDPASATPATSCSSPGGADCLAGAYWTSTQYAAVPQNDAWAVSLSAGGSQTVIEDKSSVLGARCARALVP